METFQGIPSKFLHYVFSFFLICRCKNSICNFLIPRAMGVLGGLRIQHKWPAGTCYSAHEYVRCRWKTSRSKLTPLSVSLYPFSGRVYDYQAELVIQNHTAIHQEKDLVLNPYSQAPYLASFMPQSKKHRAHPLFCAMPAGRVACDRSVLNRWSFHWGWEHLYLENNTRCTRWEV